MDIYEKFYHYLSELNQSYEKLISLLGEKMEAVIQFDINKLESIMKEEQVYVLLSKGFDTNINNYREKLALEGTTLNEQIDELPQEWRGKFRELSHDLKSSVQSVKELNDKCQELIETKLYTIDKSIKELSKSDPGVYSNAADAAKPAAQQDAPRMLFKSI